MEKTVCLAGKGERKLTIDVYFVLFLFLFFDRVSSVPMREGREGQFQLVKVNMNETEKDFLRT